MQKNRWQIWKKSVRETSRLNWKTSKLRRQTWVLLFTVLVKLCKTLSYPVLLTWECAYLCLVSLFFNIRSSCWDIYLPQWQVAFISDFPCSLMQTPNFLFLCFLLIISVNSPFPQQQSHRPVPVSLSSIQCRATMDVTRHLRSLQPIQNLPVPPFAISEYWWKLAREIIFLPYWVLFLACCKIQNRLMSYV